MPAEKADRSEESRFAILADRMFDGRRWREHAALMIEAGRIRGIAAWGEVPDGEHTRRMPAGVFLAPGLIDLQVNGGGGLLLNDNPTPEALRKIAHAHRRFGTTACLPTLITDSIAATRAAIAAARLAAGANGILGLHLEGPFISPKRPGVHRADRIATAAEHHLEWLAELAGAGRSMITLAPECVPAGFVRTLAERGLCVSAGHSEASAEAVFRAADEGLRAVTHLFNAMPPLAGREPGLVGAALADARLTAGVIMDGIHVDPVSMRAAVAAKGAGGIALVSDAMPTVGSDVDRFDLMGRPVVLRDGRLTAPDGTLAGAHLDMASAVRNAVRLAGMALGDALQCASLTPARLLGMEDERGVFRRGARADIVALTPEIKAVATWVDGSEAAGCGSERAISVS
jgi:N-acetylglucosamine-6-phosphate deacetylase